MPKIAKALSAREVSRLTKAGSHPVGAVPGLLLRISPTGASSWVLRIAMGTRTNLKGVEVPRRRDIGLGSYPAVPLAEARRKAQEKRELVQEGRDPVEERAAHRRALQAAYDNRMTFEQAAQKCHSVKTPEFRNPKHAAQWLTTLESYAFPVLGATPVEDIDTSDVLRVLEPIWLTKTVTAQRVRQRMETVIEWTYSMRKVDRRNPAQWAKLKPLLPNPAKVAQTRHFAALRPQDLPAVLSRLRSKGGMGARALEFAVLTAARSGEVRGATWGEIDRESALWRVPGTRMKAGKPHAVPLSDAALALLDSLQQGEDGDLVFKAPRGGMLSDMTLSKVLRDMEVDAVPHGMRSTFKTWAQENTRYPDEASELALAHVNSDATRAAYARSELIEVRRELMTDWAEFCLGTGMVVRFHSSTKQLLSAG